MIWCCVESTLFFDLLCKSFFVRLATNGVLPALQTMFLFARKLKTFSALTFFAGTVEWAVACGDFFVSLWRQVNDLAYIYFKHNNMRVLYDK